MIKQAIVKQTVTELRYKIQGKDYQNIVSFKALGGVLENFAKRDGYIFISSSKPFEREVISVYF